MPESIGRLSQLEDLNLSRNKLTALPESIGRLTRLRYLRAFGNELAALPESIGGLSRLENLAIAMNGLIVLPDSIGEASQVRNLEVHANRLTALPESIGRLTGLVALVAFDNRLGVLPDSIGQLTGLKQLWLSKNELTALPESLRRVSGLEHLYLHGNEALDIPPEVLGPTFEDIFRTPREPAKPADILAYYFRSRRETRRRLNEAKILIVGQGAVGKTSLVKMLVDSQKCDEHEAKTEGIDIVKWQVPARKDETAKDGEIRLNVWDFGGQEIMHATHQFFLTKRSLYLLVLDARKGENECNIHYWLKIIQSYGGDSPVLVVTNKHEDAHHLDLNETRLQRDYAPNVKGFFKVSCMTGNGIAKLRAAIEEQINGLPHVFDELPASYFTVKEKLEARARNTDYIDIEEYRALCGEYGVDNEKEQNLLIRFLHDLGNVLNFDDPDDPYKLHDTNILNPEWVTAGVYKIINNNELMQAAGVLETGRLARILDDHERYPESRHEFIVGMMRKFELCFDFPESRGERLLIPELLNPNEPDFDWRAGESLDFEYHYKVLPRGIICRFIVRTHELLTPKPTYWRSGVLINIDGNHALVRSDADGGRMYIAVFGSVKGRRRALSVIRETFRSIHATIPNLDAQEKVPLPNDPGVTVNYSHLLKLEERGKETFLPDGGDNDYDVQGLLNGLEDEKERREARSLEHGVWREHRAGTSKPQRLAEEPDSVTAEKPFDVFLSHNSKNKPAVIELGGKLRDRGLRVWLDEWELVPGRDWQKALEEVIDTAKSAAVLVGKDGLGPWEERETRGCLSQFVERGMPVIPVLLPGAPRKPNLPLFLTGLTWVDLRGGLTGQGLDRLQWGITDKKPDSVGAAPRAAE